jgi:hypothetical protein
MGKNMEAGLQVNVSKYDNGMLAGQSHGRVTGKEIIYQQGLNEVKVVVGPRRQIATWKPGNNDGHYKFTGKMKGVNGYHPRGMVAVANSRASGGDISVADEIAPKVARHVNQELDEEDLSRGEVRLMVREHPITHTGEGKVAVMDGNGQVAVKDSAINNPRKYYAQGNEVFFSVSPKYQRASISKHEGAQRRPKWMAEVDLDIPRVSLEDLGVQKVEVEPGLVEINNRGEKAPLPHMYLALKNHHSGEIRTGAKMHLVIDYLGAEEGRAKAESEHITLTQNSAGLMVRQEYEGGESDEVANPMNAKLSPKSASLSREEYSRGWPTVRDRVKFTIHDDPPRWLAVISRTEEEYEIGKDQEIKLERTIDMLTTDGTEEGTRRHQRKIAGVGKTPYDARLEAVTVERQPVVEGLRAIGFSGEMPMIFREGVNLLRDDSWEEIRMSNTGKIDYESDLYVGNQASRWLNYQGDRGCSIMAENHQTGRRVDVEVHTEGLSEN